MPRKSREVRQAELDGIREKLNNPPQHVRHRIGQPSTLSDALLSGGMENWTGLQVDPEGQVSLHPKQTLGPVIAAQKRKAEALDRAMKLEAEHGNLFWGRDGAAKIANLEGVSAKTIRRARQRILRNEPH